MSPKTWFNPAPKTLFLEQRKDPKTEILFLSFFLFISKSSSVIDLIPKLGFLFQIFLKEFYELDKDPSQKYYFWDKFWYKKICFFNSIETF